MNRWVYWVSLSVIAVIIGLPLFTILTDPQGDVRDLFKLGIDLEGGTSLIYELHPPQPGGTPPAAKDAKKVINGRIDPQGTRGYIVRAVGEHRLEIVLPGRATKVSITQEPVTPENLAALQQAALKQNRPTFDTIQEKSAAFLAGTRLVVRMKPPLYLDDIQGRITQAVRERMAGKSAACAVVGLSSAGEQWEQVVVLIDAKPGDARAIADWDDLVKTSLATQRDVTRVKRLVRQAGYLEFKIIADKVKDREKADFDRILRDKAAGQPPYTPEFAWYPLKEKRGWQWYKAGDLDQWNYIYYPNEQDQSVEVLVQVGTPETRVTGDDISRAFASSQEGDPIVSFSLNATAGTRFATLTSPENRDRQMGIILDGTIQSAPALRATLSTGGIIEGYRANVRERDEVVTILNSGKLSASLGDPVTERTVGPELGADNIHKGFSASAIGFVLVVLFMGVYYRFAGTVADLALVLNLVLTVAIMFMIRQAWTLPGIAGLILSLAMAVDANVLIYERLREEKLKGGSLLFALKKAYERAFATIFDSNLTTVIPAFVLILPGLATEEVKGFAVVMIIGLSVSMFTAVVVTRMIFETGIRGGWIKQLSMFHLFRKPNIDWMRFGRFAFVISTGMALVGVLVFVARDDTKYDIEFIGGTQVELALSPPKGEQEVSIDKVRAIADKALGGSATVQSLEYASDTAESKVRRFLVSVPAVGSAVSGEAAVKQALSAAFEEMRPAGTTIGATTNASKITEDVIRARLASLRPPAPPAPAAPTPTPTAAAPPAATPASTSAAAATATSTSAPAATATPTAAAATTVASTATAASTAASTAAPAATATATSATPTAAVPARYIPPEQRQFLDKIRVALGVSAPMTTDEIRRRLDTFVRDRYSDLVATTRKVEGVTPAGNPGEFKSFEIWIMAPFDGSRQGVENPTFWADAVRLSMGAEEAFASTTSFEPTMAGEAWDKAIIAILFSLAAMTLYIWVRFAKFSSGVAAVVATVHDVLITLGAVTAAVFIADTPVGQVLMLTDMKVNLPLVGAFLTLVGYSVNDTIVVFDRIRENRGKYGDLSVSIVNNSINQTLSRTVLTSSTVFVAVVALYFFGGRYSSIHGLSFVMLFGTVVGCYSSIAVASPILVMRSYLRKVYAWAYPILGAALLVYYGLVWHFPNVVLEGQEKPVDLHGYFSLAMAEGNTTGALVAAVLMVLAAVWFALATWAVVSEAHGRAWPVAAGSPALARMIGAVSILAPLAVVVLFAISMLVPGASAWAAPACGAALATCPATWSLVRMAWPKTTGIV